MNILITIIGSIVVFAVVFGFAAYTRYLQHKETMALAEKGLLPEEKGADKGRGLVRWGLIFSILGMILILVMVPFAWNNLWILFLLGLLPLAIGIGLLLIQVFTQDTPFPSPKAGKQEKPAPKPKKEAAPKQDKAPEAE